MQLWLFVTNCQDIILHCHTPARTAQKVFQRAKEKTGIQKKLAFTAFATVLQPIYLKKGLIFDI